MSSPLFLLRIDALGLEVFQSHKTQLAGVASFATGEQGAFAAWLQGQPKQTRFRILADLADESFEVEELPRVRGADRRALIARRLSSYYPQPAYASAESLGTDRKANTEKVLFSGLGRPARLDAWMAAASDGGLASELLISPSRLIAHFLPGIGPTSAPDTPTLVANFSRAGMRVSLVEGRRTRLSRLVEGFDAQTVLTDNAWCAELERTLHYASSLQSGLAPVTPKLLMLAPASELGAQQTRLSPGAAPMQSLDPSALATQLPNTPLTDSTALLLHWLARAPRGLGWPGPRPDRSAGSRHLHALALGTGALVFIGGILIASEQWQAARSAHEMSITLQREILNLQRERAGFEAKHAQLDAPPAQIIDMTDQLDRERASAIAPHAVLSPLADALDLTPELSLRSLSWSVAAPDTTKEGAEQPLARVELKLKPKKTQQTHGKDALKTLLTHLEAGGARDIEFSADNDGNARLALRLPLNRIKER